MNELNSKIQRGNVERDQDIIEANTKAEVAVVKAEQEKNVLIT